jgi:hypothetical protein
MSNLGCLFNRLGVYQIVVWMRGQCRDGSASEHVEKAEMRAQGRGSVLHCPAAAAEELLSLGGRAAARAGTIGRLRRGAYTRSCASRGQLERRGELWLRQALEPLCPCSHGCCTSENDQTHSVRFAL